MPRKKTGRVGSILPKKTKVTGRIGGSVKGTLRPPQVGRARGILKPPKSPFGGGRVVPKPRGGPPTRPKPVKYGRRVTKKPISGGPVKKKPIATGPSRFKFATPGQSAAAMKKAKAAGYKFPTGRPAGLRLMGAAKPRPRGGPAKRKVRPVRRKRAR